MNMESLDLRAVMLPQEAEDLHCSRDPRDDVPHLYVSLPKVVWVHVYSVLDVATLFRCQRVCVAWRNLINQPICWFGRAKALLEWSAQLPGKYGAGRDSDDEQALVAAPPDDDDDATALAAASAGAGAVAVLKRQCKALFIKRAVHEQAFNPKLATTAALLDQAAGVPDDQKEALWNEAWATEPCGKVVFERARFFEHAGRYEQAIAEYQSAVALCPFDHQIRTRLGLTYHKQNNLHMALHNYLKTAALAPGYQLAWNNAGSIFFNTGFYERAEKCFSRCIQLDSRASIAFNNRGLCHFLAGDGHAAVNDFTQAFNLNPADKTARSNRAAALLMVGDHVAAADDCLAELGRAQVVGGPPDNSVAAPYLHKHLGVAYMKRGERGDIERAAGVLTLAVQAKTDYKQAYVLLAECQRQLGLLDDAIATLRKAEAYPAPVGNNESIFQYFLR